MAGSNAKRRIVPGKKEHWGKLEEFLFYFTQQSEHGLIVIQDCWLQEAKLRIADSLPIVAVGTAEELFYVVRHRLSALIEVEPRTSVRLMKSVRQCAARAGALQSLHPDSREVVTVEYDPFESHILLVVAASEFRVVSQQFCFERYVGMIEYI